MSDAAVEVVENLPEVVETVEIVRNNPVLLVGVALFAGSLGAFGGYKYAQKKLRMYYADLADEEIRQSTAYATALRIQQSKSPEEILEETQGPGARAAVEALSRYAGETPVETEEELLTEEEQALYAKNDVPETRVEPDPGQIRIKEERRHVFQDSTPIDDDGFDPEVERMRRDAEPEKPYIITHDEYYENARDFAQIDLTYYQGDDTLVDDREQVVPDEDDSVGEDNLTRFGHGSKDANIVFVRNERLEADFEITRSMGKYAEEVLGFDMDEKGLKHSHDSGGVRRFRNRDD